MTTLTLRRRAVMAAVGLALLSTTAAHASAQTPPAAVEMVAAELGAVSTMDTAPGGNEAALAYSADGVDYSTSVPDLFARSPKLVPGESLTEKLWVRNDNAMAVDVSVAALTPGAPSWQDFGQAPQSEVTLNPGAAGSLLVWLSLPASSGNNSQGQTQAVQLRVHVSESVPGPGWDRENNELGNTGTASGIWWVGVVLVLSGAGAYLVSRRREQQQAEREGKPHHE